MCGSSGLRVDASGVAKFYETATQHISSQFQLYISSSSSALHINPLGTGDHYTLHTWYFTLHTACYSCTIYNKHCILHKKHCTLHTSHIKRNTAYCILHTADCKHNTPCCTLHSTLDHWVIITDSLWRDQ